MGAYGNNQIDVIWNVDLPNPSPASILHLPINRSIFAVSERQRLYSPYNDYTINKYNFIDPNNFYLMESFDTQAGLMGDQFLLDPDGPVGSREEVLFVVSGGVGFRAFRR